MGKLGGEELNYSSDIDLIFVYGDDGETAGGREGRLSNGEYFARVGRDDRGHARVGDRRGLRLPRGSAPAPRGALGRARPVARRLPRLLRRPRRALGAAGAHQGARLRGRRARWRARFFELVRAVRLPARARRRRSSPTVRAHEARDRPRARARKGGDARATSSSAAAASARSSSSSRRCSSSTAATTRGCASGTRCARSSASPSAATSRPRSAACSATRSSISAPSSTGCRSSTSSRPTRCRRSRRALGLLARRMGIARPPAAAAPALPRRAPARHRATCTAPSASSSPRRPAARGAAGCASRAYTALKATGFADPDRARQNLAAGPRGPAARAVRRRAARPRAGPALPGAARRALAEPGSRRGAQPVRALRVRGGTAHRATSSCSPTQPDAARRTWCGSARGGELLTQLLIAQPELLDRLADPGDLRGAEDAARRSAPRWPPCSRRGSTRAERRDLLRRLKQAEELTIDLAHAARRDRRRALLARDDRARRGHARGRRGCWRSSATVERHGVPARRARPLRARGHRRASASSAGASSRPAPISTSSSVVSAGRRDDRRRADRVDAHVFYSDAVEALAGRARRHHRGRRRLRGRSAPAARLQGQRLRRQRRRARALLSRVGRPLGATDPHARPARAAAIRALGRAGAPRAPRAALRPGAPPARPQGDARSCASAWRRSWARRRRAAST